MVAHRNCLRLLITLSAFMFFGSVQASDNNNNKENSFPNNPSKEVGWMDTFMGVLCIIKKDGTFPTGFKIKTDEGKEEIRATLTGVAIQAMIWIAVYELASPAIKQGVSVGVDYLPDAWPFSGIKKHYKLQKEEAELDRIIAQANFEEKRKKAQKFIELQKNSSTFINKEPENK